MYKLIENTIQEVPDLEMIHKVDYERMVLFNVFDDSKKQTSKQRVVVSFLSYDAKASKERKIKKAIEEKINDLND